jgi:hypothetical protein
VRVAGVDSTEEHDLGDDRALMKFLDTSSTYRGRAFDVIQS